MVSTVIRMSKSTQGKITNFGIWSFKFESQQPWPQGQGQKSWPCPKVKGHELGPRVKVKCHDVITFYLWVKVMTLDLGGQGHDLWPWSQGCDLWPLGQGHSEPKTQNLKLQILKSILNLKLQTSSHKSHTFVLMCWFMFIYKHEIIQQQNLSTTTAKYLNY